MTSSKAMGALGLMNTRVLEHPLTGTQYLQEKVKNSELNFIPKVISFEDSRFNFWVGKQKTKLHQV